MSYCLICHQKIVAKTSWNSFLQLNNKDGPICSSCEQRLEKVSGELCSSCGRPLANLPSDFYQENLCRDCYKWNEHPYLSKVLVRNHSVYLYNDFMKETLARFKFRGDYILVHAFKNSFQTVYHQQDYSSYLIAPIPLSKERMYKRGFNQSEALAYLLDQPVYFLLERLHLEKQSKKSRAQRIHSENIFSLKEADQIEGKKILLIDDIYTTGTTIRQAATVLMKAKAAAVSSLTLIRG